MLVTTWSIGLLVTTLLVAFVVLRAAYTGVRVVRFWDQSADTPLQIHLESEIWLSSTLMEFALFLQILSLLLLVLAADSFASLLVGAMCATGSFLANDYGMKALGLKLVSVFFYGFWILLHRLDVTSPEYPLVRVKYIYLLLLCPLLFADMGLQTLYMKGLQPDIITSCCGVIFQKGTDGIGGLSGEMASHLSVVFFYAGCLLLLLAALKDFPYSRVLLAAGSCALFPAGLWLITTHVSPYVYAMPHHRCPFCLLQVEYNSIGYPLVVSLYLATFSGITIPFSNLFSARPDLEAAVAGLQRRLRKILVFSLLLFAALSLFYPLKYILLGGE